LVNTPPMLAERRAVVLRGVEQLGKRKTKRRDEVVRYLASPNPTTLLVLVVAAGEEPDAEIVQASTSVALEPLSAERVPRWIQHRATTLGITLATDAGELLLKAVGNDLSTLSRELEKLASLAVGTSRPVTAEDVTSLVGVRRGETVFDLVEAALGRQVARAGQLVEPVLEQAGMSGVKILSIVALSIIPSFHLSAQTDVRLVEALRLAQSGQVDSGRSIVRRLLATLSPGDSVYPQALLAAAKIAPDAPTVASYLNRIVVEYGAGPWADDALLL